MSIERTYYCEGPSCNGHDPDDVDSKSPCHATTATAPPHLPMGFIEARSRVEGVDYLHHFCGWDCLMKFAAKQPEPTIIPWDQALGGDPDAD